MIELRGIPFSRAIRFAAGVAKIGARDDSEDALGGGADELEEGVEPDFEGSCLGSDFGAGAGSDFGEGDSASDSEISLSMAEVSRSSPSSAMMAMALPTGTAFEPSPN